ncbi:winged helix-turn-helix transcriptional regulator [Chitinophaga ginsengisegetis]|uniref:winged helix-turn-helix transcriptional regulator n=1 Tax=Chitinophaga ginsengisegetis TaxID=393003 RepID=UPI000DB99109|nr:winged helix-turn-helix transcriptional regulator [Chitinophaga ginsengisegetis]MDR6566216.1 DNA-binding HxlR family transcriptional regulator [Chitinophaga ginsengisegetis]MDR6645946.1 DNA-binding HxlR family transcriptional regulator [Chitinophaga ginsengisegetis]MDR6651462.1 DNA-binding HxlR family transcriptional regulator [Chitinophaga ginsengisegetis]
MKKETSSNSLNEQFLFLNCELNSALNMISGRWKAQIVYSIWSGNDRFSLLKRELSAISEQVLSRQLKELETHAILVKIPIPDTVPAGISYQLTSKGIALVPILQTLCDWGKQYAEGKRIHLLEDI